MKTLASIIAGLLLAVTVNAQTNTPAIDTNAPPTLPQVVTNVVHFLSSTATNWAIAGYGIYCEDTDSIGAGVAAAYGISEFSMAVMRMDYIDGEIWLPSGSIQLQLPLTVAKNVRVTPLITAGIATALDGRGSENHEAVTTLGTGVAVRINNRWEALYHIEKWSKYDGQQHRFGLAFKF